MMNGTTDSPKTRKLFTNWESLGLLLEWRKSLELKSFPWPHFNWLREEGRTPNWIMDIHLMKNQRILLPTLHGIQAISLTLKNQTRNGQWKIDQRTFCPVLEVGLLMKNLGAWLPHNFLVSLMEWDYLWNSPSSKHSGLREMDIF